MNNELQHYGVIGMKWGKRKAQRYSNIARSQRQSAKDWESDSSIPSHVRKRNAALDRKTAAKYEKKAAAVNKSLAKTKSNIKKYNKAYSELDKARDKADKAEARMKEAYKATGRNVVSRVLNNMFNKKSAAVKAYNKAYNEAGRAMDKADSAEARMKKAYVATGRNRIERVLNNAYYAKHR